MGWAEPLSADKNKEQGGEHKGDEAGLPYFLGGGLLEVALVGKKNRKSTEAHMGKLWGQATQPWQQVHVVSWAGLRSLKNWAGTSQSQMPRSHRNQKSYNSFGINYCTAMRK